MKSQSRNNQSYLMASIARHIAGEKISLRIKGSSDKIKVTQEAIHASKDLFEELNRPTPTLDRIFELVEKKNIKAQEFTRVTGLCWVL